MKFECPHCRQHLEVDALYAGQSTRCPACGGTMQIPTQAGAGTDREHSAMPPEQGQREGIDPATNAAASASSGTLATEPGSRYKIGAQVAKGGMGAILEAHDVNLRRGVAMKVLLDPGTASREDMLRFVEEAQVTGQLEHPGIVPVYELAMGPDG